MAWTSMHFAVGMAGSGMLAAGACLRLRRGWRWIPLVTTFGGLWACVPDMPRLWREDFPSLPFASVLGRKSLENTLHNWGDLFFFHHYLDHHRQEHQYALHGLIMMILFYTLGIGLLLFLERRARLSAASLSRRVQGAPHHGQDHPQQLLYSHRVRSSHLMRVEHDTEIIARLVHGERVEDGPQAKPAQA